MFAPVSGWVETIGWLGPGVVRGSSFSDAPGRSFIAVSMMFACLIVIPAMRCFISGESAS
jgi:hypothetical protein